MLQVYKQIKVNLKAHYTADEGLAMIEAKTNILVDCFRLIIVEGGPKTVNLTFHSESSQLTLTPRGRRSL